MTCDVFVDRLRYSGDGINGVLGAQQPAQQNKNINHKWRPMR